MSYIRQQSRNEVSNNDNSSIIKLDLTPVGFFGYLIYGRNKGIKGFLCLDSIYSLLETIALTWNKKIQSKVQQRKMTTKKLSIPLNSRRKRYLAISCNLDSYAQPNLCLLM